MIRPPSLLKASLRRTSSSRGANAVPRRAYNSLDDTEGIFPSMRNLLGMRVLRRAWTVCRLTGSLHFPARKNQRVRSHQHDVTAATKVFAAARAHRTSATPRSDDAPCMQHVACPVLPETHRELRRSSYRKLGQRNGTGIGSRRPGNGRPCLRKTFLISMGSETTLGCLAADRAAVECPEYLSSRCRSMMKVGKMHIPPTALGPASGLSAVLGRDALDSRATAIRARRR